MKIDAHQHFWNFDVVPYAWPTENEKAIFRNIEAQELEPLLKQTGVDRTVIVQADDSYADTDYMLETAQKYDWVAGVVGWAPLNRPEEAQKKLEQYAQNPYFKGVRHLIHMEEDPNWVVSEEVIAGLKILAQFKMTFDIVSVLPVHLDHVPTLAEQVPELNMVIDHLSKPSIKEQLMEPWASQMKTAAQYPNVYAKISGLNTAADPDNWSAKDLKPYVDYVFDIFGAQRLMFGSDWPVANLAGDYVKVWQETNHVLQGRTQQEIDAVLGDTAKQFYHLNA